jgi:hypothetical protein
MYIRELAPLDSGLDFTEPKLETEETGLLDRLKTELAHPLLNMLKRYLYASRSHENKKVYICLAEFRKEHPGSFRLVFIGDLLLQFLYLSIFIATVLRGLGFSQPLIDSTKLMANSFQELATEFLYSNPCATPLVEPMRETPLATPAQVSSNPLPVDTSVPTPNP